MGSVRFQTARDQGVAERSVVEDTYDVCPVKRLVR
jgi:hypothetical protein